MSHNIVCRIDLWMVIVISVRSSLDTNPLTLLRLWQWYDTDCDDGPHNNDGDRDDYNGGSHHHHYYNDNHFNSADHDHEGDGGDHNHNDYKDDDNDDDLNDGDDNIVMMLTRIFKKDFSLKIFEKL